MEHACPGITYVPEARQTDVVLVPTILLRPGYVILDHRSANVFGDSAAAGARSDAPPERLVAQARAMGEDPAPDDHGHGRKPPPPGPA